MIDFPKGMLRINDGEDTVSLTLNQQLFLLWK